MNAEPVHTVEQISNVAPDKHIPEGRTQPGEAWLIDGVRWWRWTHKMAVGRWTGGIRAPEGWYSDRQWLSTGWKETSEAFDPLMSAVIQAIWEAHRGR